MTRSLAVLTLSAALAANAWGAAANINFGIPQNFASSSRKSDGTVSGVAWNINGTRCVYSQSTGFTNLGVNVSAATVILDGFTTPVLTVYADGVARAQATSKFVADDGTYSLYTAGLTTKCVGGPNAGTTCNAQSACGTGGACVMCDQNNNCNTSGTVQAPCVTGTCSGGTNAGAPCASGSDCNSGTCQTVTFPSGVGTCYLEQACTTNGSNTCKTTGATSTGSGGASFHSALAVVRSGATIDGNTEKLVNYVTGSANTPFSNCSNNCDGGIDEMMGSTAAIVCEH